MPMQNLTYSIKEKSENKEFLNIDEFINQVDENHEILSMPSDCDDFIAMELDYSTNYNVKELGQILDYYKISKRKLRKDEMVQVLIIFEKEEANMGFVRRRKLMWQYVEELKKDEFFNKFVLF